MHCLKLRMVSLMKHVEETRSSQPWRDLGVVAAARAGVICSLHSYPMKIHIQPFNLRKISLAAQTFSANNHRLLRLNVYSRPAKVKANLLQKFVNQAPIRGSA